MCCSSSRRIPNPILPSPALPGPPRSRRASVRPTPSAGCGAGGTASSTAAAGSRSRAAAAAARMGSVGAAEALWPPSFTPTDGVCAGASEYVVMVVGVYKQVRKGVQTSRFRHQRLSAGQFMAYNCRADGYVRRTYEGRMHLIACLVSHAHALCFGDPTVPALSVIECFALCGMRTKNMEACESISYNFMPRLNLRHR